MKNYILSKIDELSLKSKYIKTYPSNTISILRGMGKITGEVDKQHIEFLKVTNGMSILDYCFWGFKNPNLHPRNIYEEMMDIWYKYNSTSSYFWCIAGNSIGEYFGYIPQKDTNGNHFIAYFNEKKPDEVIILASSFNIFLNMFLEAISDKLNTDKEALDIDYTLLLNIDTKLKNDIDLELYLKTNPRVINLFNTH